jgi:hypothetical protein
MYGIILMEPYVCFNKSKIIVFDPTMPTNSIPKYFVGFHGYGCNVTLSIGEINLNCYDHKITCNLIHSNIHEVVLLMEQHPNVIDWTVILYFTNNKEITTNIVDETIDEIITSVAY